ncbi:unnamed protein product [Symbiodinium natans]|uniref:Uncharacterized protein n=1 Tax=Symbiodinium natans TaxID=878477 RepID=A0A812UHB4_9DINO|nr:unnamed protein product [Symbiodinium natans]
MTTLALPFRNSKLASALAAYPAVNPDDDDWVKNPDIRSYWTAPDAKLGGSIRQVPVPAAASGRYAGIAAELTSYPGMWAVWVEPALC